MPCFIKTIFTYLLAYLKLGHVPAIGSIQWIFVSKNDQHQQQLHLFRLRVIKTYAYKCLHRSLQTQLLVLPGLQIYHCSTTPPVTKY